ncbi:LTA synthase family protein [Achromobacter spanius]|uniref:LTA synthase family protein n=1 Tax=Achromobacter spanius TaxID=217203 RepID=A0AA42LR01_9BURK|nr:LTA synthase family protein [Achromobacter spanius]MDH0737952.1 LTA synthase family protein [Achromobacter spanius]
MIEAFWIPLLPPYLIGLVLSFAVEALLTPRPVAPWRRPMAAVGVHVGVWTLAFALELMLFRRPYFAVANVLAIELLIVLVSNAKYKALKEPFVYPDFEYFLDAVKHPRLYLPFFGVGKALAAGGGYGVALWAGLTLEDSVTAGAGVWLASFAELPQEGGFDSTVPVGFFFSFSAGLALIGSACIALGNKGQSPRFDAIFDLRNMGLFTALSSYRECERRPIAAIRQKAPFAAIAPAERTLALLPDMVVIQSESFFDVRRAYPKLIQQNVLANFDVLKSEAIEHGTLRVEAWGANTVRTEFGFLSGIRSQALGVHQYNPYRKLTQSPFPSLPSYLQSLGYRTICVHPYYRSFYRRHRALPMLGFDEFIDISAFGPECREGAYVGDRALGEMVSQLLDHASDGPLYVHVITMENHGPLHWEQITPEDEACTMTRPLPAGCRDLIAYVKHLRNADAMFGQMRETLLSRNRHSVLCLFGDHVPIMPGVYRALGQSDGQTDYVLWRSDLRQSSPPCAADVTSLALRYSEIAGLIRATT